MGDPFGDMQIHSGLIKTLMKKMDLKRESAESGDNTVEIQIAMIKYFFPESKLLAIRSPSSLKADDLGREVAEILSVHIHTDGANGENLLLPGGGSRTTPISTIFVSR
jgi:AmmeMemoRadiSam system protein B